MDPVDGSTKTIAIDKTVWPYRWIRWTNVLLLSTFVLLPLEVLSSLLKGDAESALVASVSLALFAFPSWIIWQNIDVVHSVGQKYTIRTLLFCGAMFALIAGLVMIAGMYGALGSPQGVQTDRWVGFLYGGNILIPGLLAFIAAWAVARLRKCSIAGLDIRLSVLIADLRATERGKRPRQLRAQRPMLGWALIASAAAVWLAGDLFGPVGSQDPTRLAFLLVVFARASFQPTATALLKDDHRAPILLLRSFLDDERINWRNATRTFLDTSLESRLASHFARFGPFIAVGTPMESVPVVGAARAQLGDADWRKQILSWIDRSHAILIMVGTTHWVNWELQQVIAHRGVQRLIACFPPIAARWIGRPWGTFGKDMEARLACLRAAFAGTTWAPALEGLEDAKTLRSVAFGSDGRITVVRTKSRDRNAYHLAVLIAHWVLLREPAATSGLAAASRSDAQDFQADCDFALDREPDPGKPSGDASDTPEYILSRRLENAGYTLVRRGAAFIVISEGKEQWESSWTFRDADHFLRMAPLDIPIKEAGKG